EAEPSKLLEDHRPAQDEDDIHVEGDEEQREDIEGQRKLHPGAANRRLARLVDRALVARAALAQKERVEQVRCGQPREHKRAAAEEEEQGDEVPGCDHKRLLHGGSNAPPRWVLPRGGLSFAEKRGGWAERRSSR